MLNIYRERLLNCARAVRESPYPELFTMLYTFHHDGLPACVLGRYIARHDLQTNWWREGMATHQREDVNFYFGITPEECAGLFGCNGCGNAQTTEAAARYIEAFITRKWPSLDPAFEKLREEINEKEVVAETETT